MKIAILMTNTDESDFAQRHPKDGEKFADFIQLVRPEWETVVFSVKDGNFPSDITEFDGFMITGSPASVGDSADWINRLLSLIQDIHVNKIPMFGVCFGHQAIAVALGGTLLRNPQGWGHGVLRTWAVAPFPWGDQMGEIDLYASHIEQVSQLPNGARRIASSEGCENAGFILGDHILTIQHHPEMTHDFISALVDELEDYVGIDVTKHARTELSTRRADREQFAQWVAQFIEHGASKRSS
jgi:GMP synthase-like glutamine amidotransferase